MIRIKRTYESPARTDGRRILVERLWPRGMKKEDLHADGWMKDVAPSTELRKWFSHDPEKWQEFRRRYVAELDRQPETWQPLIEAAGSHDVTLLYSSRDREHNNAVVLREYLQAHMAKKGKG